MSQADTLDTTPKLRPPAVTAVTPGLYPSLPAGMPTVTDFARFARHVAAEMHRIDTADPTLWAQGVQTRLASDWQGKSLTHATAIHAAIEGLAAVLPARNLFEATVLLNLAGDIVLSLAGAIDPPRVNEPPALEEAKRLLGELDVILVNTVPVLAAIAGVDAAAIGAKHLADRRALPFGPIGLEAAP
jgi:hypothetical protein